MILANLPDLDVSICYSWLIKIEVTIEIILPVITVIAYFCY